MIDAISNALADPTLAYALYVVGTLAILYEIFKPGSIFPGVAGGTMVAGAILASRALPVRPVAVFAIAVGLALLTAEVFVRARGVLALFGLVSLVIGGINFTALSDAAHAGLHPAVAGIGAVVTALLVIVGGRRIVADEASTNNDVLTIVGARGEWLGHGLARVDGVLWRASSPSPLAAHAPIIVTAAHGFELVVAGLESGYDPPQRSADENHSHCSPG